MKFQRIQDLRNDSDLSQKQISENPAHQSAFLFSL